MIYKILRAEEWRALETHGRFDGSPDDRRDGFIHFSSAAQACETARRHYAGVKGCVLAEVDETKLPAGLAWEPSRGGELFPHLYAALPLAAVIRSWPLDQGLEGLGPAGQESTAP